MQEPNNEVKICKEPVLEGLEFDGDTVLCRVCGDKASGFHYGVHACEGCKGFFRRSIQQKIQYRPCLKNQQCNIMRVNRNRCQYCRLKKCIAVGMSRDAVRFGRVPKKEKAKIMEQMQKVNNQSQSNILNSILDMEVDIAHKIIEAHLSTCDFTRVKFKAFMERNWQNPDFVNCPAHMACPLNPNPSMNEGNKRWEEFSECFTPAIRNVVNFAKCIPGFQVLSQEDQVTLLKAGTFEVLLVHLACLFDSQSNTMMFTNGKLYKRVSLSQVTNSAGFLLDSMFDFAERLNALNLTEDEIALFSAIVIIASDRPGLRSVEQVEKIQSRITQALQTVMSHNHPEDPAIFAKLLMKIPDLRTLNTLHSEKLLGLSLPASNRPQTDKLKTSSENQPPPAYFQSGMLPPGFPPIYSSHIMSGHPGEGDTRFPSRPPDIPGLPLPLDPPGHPTSMLFHSPYGAFHQFTAAMLNIPPTDPEYEIAGQKSQKDEAREGKERYTTNKPIPSIGKFGTEHTKASQIGEAPTPAIWSPAAMHVTDAHDRSGKDTEKQPNVITKPLYPPENTCKRSSIENLADSKTKMARMWDDDSVSKSIPSQEFAKPNSFPYFPYNLYPFPGDRHNRSASESEVVAPPAGQEINHQPRMKSLSESESLALERSKARPIQDHPVLKTALNTPPLTMRKERKDDTVVVEQDQKSDKSGDSPTIDVLETQSEGSKCSSPASNVSEPYYHKKLKLKRRTSAEGSDCGSGSPEGSSISDGFKQQEVEGLKNKMDELLRPSWKSQEESRSPRLSPPRLSPHRSPRLSPMQEDKEPQNGVTVTSGFSLNSSVMTSHAIPSHPAYLPQFPSLHPALLYQYNQYAMQHQLAQLQHMQLLSQHKSEAVANQDHVIKDNNQNSIISKTSSPLNLTTNKLVNSTFATERLLNVKDEPI